jgi:hypothetical protein
VNNWLSRVNFCTIYQFSKPWFITFV